MTAQLLKDLNVFPNEIVYQGRLCSLEYQNDLAIGYLSYFKRHCRYTISFPKAEFWTLVDKGVVGLCDEFNRNGTAICVNIMTV